VFGRRCVSPVALMHYRAFSLAASAARPAPIVSKTFVKETQ
jgi:hypothetical protein